MHCSYIMWVGGGMVHETATPTSPSKFNVFFLDETLIRRIRDRSIINDSENMRKN